MQRQARRIQDTDLIGAGFDIDLAGWGDFVIPVELGWPPSAHRAVADWRTMAEELEATVQEVMLLANFDNFKKVKKPVLEQCLTKIYGVCDQVARRPGVMSL